MRRELYTYTTQHHQAKASPKFETVHHNLLLTHQTSTPSPAKMTNSTLSIALQNTSTSPQIYAYITGLSLDPATQNQRFLLQADGKTAYFPSSPANTGASLSADCGIAVGAPGVSRTVTIPRLAGGRIYFCYGEQLTFLLNPGPGLVSFFFFFS